MTTQSEFKRDEVLFHQGSAAKYVLRIVAGEVEVLREVGRSLCPTWSCAGR